MSEIWSKMYIGLHVRYSLFLSDFNKTWLLSTDFRKILQYQISWKSVNWEPNCSMRKGGQTDRRTYRHNTANSRVSQICERAWKRSVYLTDVRLQLHIWRLTHIWIMYKTEAPTSQRTQSIYIIKTDQLMDFSKITSIFWENYTKLTNTLLGGRWNSFLP